LVIVANADHLMNSQPGALQTAEKMAQQAIDKDPAFVGAYAGAILSA
jgi:hypothetical protein